MYSTGFAMTLKPGCYARYKNVHDNLWPEIAESMIRNHVNMVILRLGERLIVHATAPTEADWDRSREGPALPKWQALMTELLEDDGEGDVAFEPLETAFEFGEFRND